MRETAPSRTAATTAGPDPGAAGWSAWHLHLASGARSLQERVLLQVVGPTVAALGRPWFFVRYWQGGPHLRLRLHGLAADELDRVERLLRDGLATAGVPVDDEEPVDPAAYRSNAARLAAAGEAGVPLGVADLLPPGVHRSRYEPEIDRYGGPGVMADTERLFGLSSELVLAHLRSGPSNGARSLLAMRATRLAAAALGGPADQAAFYAHGCQAWREWATRFGYSAEQIEHLCATARASVRGGRRGVAPAGDPRPAPEPGPAAAVHPTRSAPDPGPATSASGPGESLGQWYTGVSELVAVLRQRSTSHPAMVIFSHVHMLHNRLGLSVPDELRTYARLAHLYPFGDRVEERR